MAADGNWVKYGPAQDADHRDEPGIGSGEPESVHPGTTWSEFVAKVGDMKMPGDGFADDLEALQAAQGLAEMPEWSD